MVCLSICRCCQVACKHIKPSALGAREPPVSRSSPSSSGEAMYTKVIFPPCTCKRTDCAYARIPTLCPDNASIAPGIDPLRLQQYTRGAVKSFRGTSPHSTAFTSSWRLLATLGFEWLLGARLLCHLETLLWQAGDIWHAERDAEQGCRQVPRQVRHMPASLRPAQLPRAPGCRAAGSPGVASTARPRPLILRPPCLPLCAPCSSQR